MVKKREPICNARGERMFDIIWTEKNILIETYQKGVIKRMPLTDETNKVFEALSQDERLALYARITNLMASEMSLA